MRLGGICQREGLREILQTSLMMERVVVLVDVKQLASGDDSVARTEGMRSCEGHDVRREALRRMLDVESGKD